MLNVLICGSNSRNKHFSPSPYRFHSKTHEKWKTRVKTVVPDLCFREVAALLPQPRGPSGCTVADSFVLYMEAVL